MGEVIVTSMTVLVVGAIFVLWNTLLIVSTREEVVQERLGKFAAVLPAGFHLLIPFIDRVAYRQERREQVIDIPPQSCITRDNIQVEVDGLVFLKVVDTYKASYGIANYRRASINLAQTTMRSEIGKLTLEQTFSEREDINKSIVKEIDTASDPWGIKMMRYEIKNITPSPRVLETLEKQMEAERQKRAQITLAVSEGERQEAINNRQARRGAVGRERVATAIRRPGEMRQFIESQDPQPGPRATGSAGSTRRRGGRTRLPCWPRPRPRRLPPSPPPFADPEGPRR